MKYLSLILILFNLISCSKSDDQIVNEEALVGKWIEISKRADTIYFHEIDKDPFFILSRGKELIDGNYIPKAKSGIYSYKITPNQIEIYWLASSSTQKNRYYFSHLQDKIVIQNFFDSKLPDKLTFERMK